MLRLLFSLVLAGLVLVGLMAIPALAEPVIPGDPKLIQTKYEVADLVIPIKDHSPPPLAGLTMRVGNWKPAEQPRGGVGTNEKKLIDEIQRTVDPKSWKNAGGAGTIQYVALGHRLIVSQTPANQAHVSKLIEKLRREQDVEVSITVHVVSVPAAAGHRWIEAMALSRMKSETEKKAIDGVAVSKKQADAWLDILSEQPDAVVTMLPKTTLFDRQAAWIGHFDHRAVVTALTKTGAGPFEAAQTPVAVGTVIEVRPVVSPDRRETRLRFVVATNALQETFSRTLKLAGQPDVPIQEHTIRKRTLSTVENIPAGMTLVARISASDLWIFGGGSWYHRGWENRLSGVVSSRKRSRSDRHAPMETARERAAAG